MNHWLQRLLENAARLLPHFLPAGASMANLTPTGLPSYQESSVLTKQEK
jgi:hypothetical protein